MHMVGEEFTELYNIEERLIRGDENAIREKPNMTYWSEEWEGRDSRKFSSHI